MADVINTPERLESNHNHGRLSSEAQSLFASKLPTPELSDRKTLGPKISGMLDGFGIDDHENPPGGTYARSSEIQPPGTSNVSNSRGDTPPIPGAETMSDSGRNQRGQGSKTAESPTEESVQTVNQEGKQIEGDKGNPQGLKNPKTDTTDGQNGTVRASDSDRDKGPGETAKAPKDGPIEPNTELGPAEGR